MKKRWLLFLVILISVSIVRAEIEVKNIAVRDTVLPGQDAEFTLRMTSNVGDTVSLSYSDDFWRAKISPGQVILPAGSPVDNIKIILYPLGNAMPGNYVFKLRIVNANTQEIIQEYPINVVLADKNNAVNVDVLTSALDPTLPENQLQLRFENNYNIKLEGLKASITSKLFTYDATMDLEPNGNNREDIVVKLDNNIAEGDYDMDIKLSINNVELTTIKKSITVGRVSDIKRNIDFVGGLFSKAKEIEFVNEGNSVVKQTYTESLSTLEDFFTATNPKPSQIQKQDGERSLTWDIELMPGESRTIALTTGYRGFVIFLIILLALIGLWYFVLGKEVSIIKKVVNASGEHDAFGNIRVSLHIRNRSKHRMYNLRVLDKIPGYLRPEKEEFTGMHPLHTKRSLGGGMALIWNIPSVDVHGESVITYRIKTKLPVFGKVMLPTATVRYRNARGKILNSYSNRMILFSLPGYSE